MLFLRMHLCQWMRILCMHARTAQSIDSSRQSICIIGWAFLSRKVNVVDVFVMLTMLFYSHSSSCTRQFSLLPLSPLLRCFHFVHIWYQSKLLLAPLHLAHPREAFPSREPSILWHESCCSSPFLHRAPRFLHQNFSWRLPIARQLLLEQGDQLLGHFRAILQLISSFLLRTLIGEIFLLAASCFVFSRPGRSHCW